MPTIKVPVLDLSQANISQKWNSLVNEQVDHVSIDLVKALYEVGFLYVINHGIPKEEIKDCADVGKRFFELPMEIKLKLSRDGKFGNCGYLPSVLSDKSSNDTIRNGKNTEINGLVVERFDFNKPWDLKEVLDICHNCDNRVWSDHNVTNFESVAPLQIHSRKLISRSQQLVYRVMELLGHGLMLQDKLDDPQAFTQGFSSFSSPNNTSQLRYLYYPAVESQNNLRKDQMRCGEHTDYGVLTLVYMDTTPGLQVFTRKGYYIDVDPMEGAILVNIGDLLQRWSGDELYSAKHRVIFRPDTYSKERYSLIYFSHPDDDFVVAPVTKGSEEKYPAVKTVDHMNRRFHDTFKEGKGLDEQLTAPAEGDNSI